MKRTLVLLACIALTGLAMAKSEKMVVFSTNYQDFSTQFCAANPSKAQIFILPNAIFNSHKIIKCQNGTFTLRVSEPQEDIGHNIYNIDPPKGVTNALDCDGKADIGMERIAINCYPVRKESVRHPRT